MKALRYAKRLISFESPSQKTNRLISKYLERKLTKYGFVVERLEYRDENQVRKVSLVAKKGTGQGGLAYFAHSDTVPAERWHSRKYGPFEPGIARGRLYGRGACDMKGSIACMLSASQAIDPDRMKAPLYVVITADEEVGYLGARQVVEESKLYREMVAASTPAIIGEPTLLEVVHAHKGSCGFKVISTGRAAHSSTNEGINANLAMIPFLQEMKAIHDETEVDPQWRDERFDPPTISWNIGINDHTAAINVTPPKSICTVYFRPMPGQDPNQLLKRCERMAEEHGLYFEKHRHGDPFLTPRDSRFLNTALELAHRTEARTVSYGTDGGVLTELPEKIVFGPGSIAQAHTFDEWIELEQLTLGTEMYGKFIRHFCGG